MKFSCTKLTQNLYILGGFIYFFHTSQSFLWAFYFFLFQCAFHSRFATQCRRKNSSAKSKQGKIEDMHFWRCFPVGASINDVTNFSLFLIPPFHSHFSLTFDPLPPSMISFVIYGRPLRMQATFFVFSPSKFRDKNPQQHDDLI